MIEQELLVGEIVDFSGSWGSGIATLTIKHDDESIKNYSCENAEMVRALDSAFGNVITSGHSVNVNAIKGKRIEFKMTDYGIIAGFSPLED